MRSSWVLCGFYTGFVCFFVVVGGSILLLFGFDLGSIWVRFGFGFVSMCVVLGFLCCFIWVLWRFDVASIRVLFGVRCGFVLGFIWVVFGVRVVF